MEAYEDAALRRVFAISLQAEQADANAKPPVVFLEGLAKELREETLANGSAAPVLLNKDTAERALMARLSDPPATYPLWPAQYLLGCYARASEEARAASQLKDPTDQRHLLDTLALARTLAVSYTGFTLMYGMFPVPRQAQYRGVLQLLDSMFVAAAASGLGSGLLPAPGAEPLILEVVTSATEVLPMPSGFLDDFAARFQEEGLADVAKSIAEGITARLSSLSVLGEYAVPLSVLERLVTCKPLAAALVNLPVWLPAAEDNGRGVEFRTVLGPAFGISAIPDWALDPAKPGVRLPDVATQCFTSEDGKLGAAAARAASDSVYAALSQLHSQLHRIMMTLLRNTDTREGALDWLAAALSSNAERTKMQPDLKKASTDGFMLNVAAVALKLCGPFLDPRLGKAWDKLDARYLSDPDARAHSFAEDTRLGMTSEEVTAWISQQGGDGAEAGGGPARKYHFICESFFIAAQALRLGFSKGMENCQSVARAAQHYAADAESALAEGGQVAAMQGELLRRYSARFSAIAMCYEVTLEHEGWLEEALRYYELLAAYMLRLVCPTAAAGGPPTLPLPEPAPAEFASLPEHLVEDLCGLTLWVGRATPTLLASQSVTEQFMLFFTVFLGSPVHVKNPYLRGRMVEVLHSFMPQDEGEASLGQRRRGGRGGDGLAVLFEVHPLVVQHMVRSLITLYVDIERTDRHNAFYEKFNTRYKIGEVLAYLWRLPQHRDTWRRCAEQDAHLYVRFVNMMINDSQHLLQEALEELPKVQETERLQADGAAWGALTQEERGEREGALRSARRTLRSDFALAAIYLRMMEYTSEDARVAARFFDVQVKERQARILNFFLRYLTLPEERRRLKLKDPERYGWRPRELIASLAAIHVNLYRVDRTAWAAAVAADTDYYGPAPRIFPELVGVLRTLGLASGADVADLEALAAEAAAVKAGAEAEEEAFDDVPEEFEDPVSCRVMSDPVKLPSGAVMDRGTILQHLLTDQRDPFTRAPMTEADLVEEAGLRGRIEGWLAEQRSAKRAAGGEGEGAEAMQE